MLWYYYISKFLFEPWLDKQIFKVKSKNWGNSTSIILHWLLSLYFYLFIMEQPYLESKFLPWNLLLLKQNLAKYSILLFSYMYIHFKGNSGLFDKTFDWKTWTFFTLSTHYSFLDYNTLKLKSLLSPLQK